MFKLAAKEIVISRGNKKGTTYLINPKLLSSARLNVKPTLKTIETHTLKALIIEDLKIHPNSSVTQIFEHMRKEVPREEIQRAVYKLIAEERLIPAGGETNRTYKLNQRNL